MPSLTYELNPVSRITIGAVGVPGQRVFLLQASTPDQTITLKMEKEQVYALARGIEELLEKLEQQEQIPGAGGEEPDPDDLILDEALEPLFAIRQMGLAFDMGAGMMVLVVAEGVGAEGESSDDVSTARFWASPAQMRALSRHAKGIVEAGRPTCPLCGRPMDPGHACSRGNGHGKGISD